MRNSIPNIIRPKRFGSNEKKSGRYCRKQINFTIKGKK